PGSGNTPLLQAVELGFVEGVELLINAGVNIYAKAEKENTALILAVLDGNTQIVRLLLNAAGSSPEAFVNQENTYGCTALLAAAWRGSAEIVEMLVAAKAQVNVALKKDMEFA